MDTVAVPTISIDKKEACEILDSICLQRNEHQKDRLGVLLTLIEKLRDRLFQLQKHNELVTTASAVGMMSLDGGRYCIDFQYLLLEVRKQHKKTTS